MIRPGFLDERARGELTRLARDGTVAHRLARRANALVLLDRGLSCAAVAEVLLLDDDTIRTWHKSYAQTGIQSLAEFGYRGSAPRLSQAQQDQLRAWITRTLPRTTREVGAWIEAEFGIVYDSRSGLVKLLHRLGMEHRRPEEIARKLDPAKQAAFIAFYMALLKQMQADEVVLFGDAVHPLHEVRPMGCWAPAGSKLAVPQTSGRDRLNVHGAIDLETGRTCMLETASVDAISTIRLLMAISAAYPTQRLIHVFLDNARYHHAKLVKEWLAQPGCRIRLHFIPTYCPHLNPIERLWGEMHKTVTHNRCHARFADFKDALLTFLCKDVPKNWRTLCDKVTDNFRVITPKDFRVMA
jgi:transposase